MAKIIKVRSERCPECSNGANDCPYCTEGYSPNGQRCTQCKGSGLLKCANCNGKGVILTKIINDEQE